MPPKRSHGPELYDVVDVIDKKLYKGQTYYKLKWADGSEPTWELKANCHCQLLIQKFEAAQKRRAHEEENDEWEVEKILDKRTNSNNEIEYLLKWRNWTGEPTWEKEDSCNCINLIAAFENPKLRKMWNFEGNNPRLWLERKSLLRFMKKHARMNTYRVNLIEFDPDMPPKETQPQLTDGINIGPLSYKNHWYLIIILVNHICITRQVLIGDPLNTLLGSANVRVHPVYKRLRGLFDKNFPIKPIVMTPMERSDLCAFYVLAAYERALFLFQQCARFVVNKLFFDTNRPEAIRCQLLPESDGEISVALPVSVQYIGGPRCEFCDRTKLSFLEVDEHIKRRHFRKD